VNRHDANWESAQPGTLIAQMAGIFRRRRRVTKSTVAGTKAHADAATGPALRFEPLGRGAVPATWYWSRVIESVSRPERPNAEERSALEVAALREELKREQADKQRALAEAERQRVKALAEQRAEIEEDVRDRLDDVAGIRDELVRERAEIQAELAAIRAQRSRTERQLAAVLHPSAHAAQG
jgi:hypothetical protein